MSDRNKTVGNDEHVFIFINHLLPFSRTVLVNFLKLRSNPWLGLHPEQLVGMWSKCKWGWEQQAYKPSHPLAGDRGRLVPGNITWSLCMSTESWNLWVFSASDHWTHWLYWRFACPFPPAFQCRDGCYWSKRTAGLHQNQQLLQLGSSA